MDQKPRGFESMIHQILEQMCIRNLSSQSAKINQYDENKQCSS